MTPVQAFSREAPAERFIAETRLSDVTRVITVGHPAGGHLALWAAARHKWPSTSALYRENPLRIM